MTRATRERHLTRKHKLATSYLPTPSYLLPVLGDMMSENLEGYHRAVNPRRLQILRIDGKWVIDDVIMQGT